MKTLNLTSFFLLASLNAALLTHAASTAAEEAIPANQSKTSLEKQELNKPLKSFNLSLNPLWLPFGFFDGQFDVGVTNSTSLGLYTSLFNYSTDETQITSTGIGLRLNYYLSGERFTDGWYTSPFIQVIPTKWQTSYGTWNYTSFSFGGIFGHQWVFRTGFNIMVGGGVSYYTAKDSTEINGKTISASRGFTGVWPTGEVRLGYLF